MTVERKWSLRDSAGMYGRLVDQDEAIKAYNGIDPQRRPFVEVTCWVRVVDATADTIPPPDADPFSEASIRAAMPTLRKGDE